MENWPLNDQVVNILKVGLSGFAFLVILMSYFLLQAEQKRESEARENVLKSIHRFTTVSIFFVMIVGGFSLLELFLKPSNTDNPSKNYDEALKRMVLLSQSPTHDTESLRKLIKNTVDDCISAEKSKRP